jgi:hypothetical protein
MEKHLLICNLKEFYYFALSKALKGICALECEKV